MLRFVQSRPPSHRAPNNDLQTTKMSDQPHTHKSKIGSLPHAVRVELCQRLLNGQAGSEVLPWINALPEVVDVLKRRWNGAEINDQNLCDWRRGGYVEWLSRQTELEQTQAMSERSLELAYAGGHRISDGVAALAAMRLLKEWEACTNEKRRTKLFNQLLDLREGDQKKQKLELEETKLHQAKRQLDLDEAKFHTLAVRKFIDWAQRPEAQAILSSEEPESVKMDQLHLLLWGKAPTKTEGS